VPGKIFCKSGEFLLAKNTFISGLIGAISAGMVIVALPDIVRGERKRNAENTRFALMMKNLTGEVNRSLNLTKYDYKVGNLFGFPKERLIGLNYNDFDLIQWSNLKDWIG